MQVTAIKQQVKRSDRYSIFIDGKYAFSLSEVALLETRVVKGLELDNKKLKELKSLSSEDKLYQQTLKYVAMRPKTEWEVSLYLKRKSAAPETSQHVIDKLKNLNLIDDKKYAQSFVKDHHSLRHSSRRKITALLRKKHIDSTHIKEALGDDKQSETAALAAIIKSKRRQSKYQDDLKLMQYLARQGFNYEDIKYQISTAKR